jgi:hypothetical protein
MSAFEAYKEYIALKNHFTKADYDYIKYNGKTGLKYTSFEKRKDKVFFEKLSKIENVCDFLVANFSIDPKLWIRDLAYSESAQITYQNWKKRNQSLTYIYKTEFKKIVEEPGGRQHPAALRLYLGKEISLESLCIFAVMTNAVKTWDSKLEYDPIWEDIRMRIVKYTPFIKFERDKIKQIMLDIMSDMEYTK